MGWTTAPTDRATTPPEDPEIPARDDRPAAPDQAATHRVDRALERAAQDARAADEPVVLAVSGGLDSSVLLARWPRRFGPAIVAHVHHGLRGGAADHDEAFVRDQAAARGIRCVVARLDLTGGRGSVETRARAARYRALARIARAHGASRLVTAHHRDDQVETVFMRIARRAGPDGLAGMRERAPCPFAPALTVCRPLLAVNREDLAECAREQAIDFVHDETNDDLRAAERNRLRHRVLPALVRVDPTLPARLLRIAALAGDGADRIRGVVNAELARVVEARGPGWLRVDRDALRRCAPALRPWLLREAARTLAPGEPPLPGRQSLGDLEAALLGGRTHPDGWSVRRGLVAATDARAAILATPAQWRVLRTPWPARRLHGAIDVPDGRRITLATGESLPPTDRVADAVVERLDAARAGRGLAVRPPRPEDVITPLGRRRPIRVVAYLAKRGLPAFERRRTLVITAGETRVVAIPGHTVDHAVRVTPDTHTIHEITVRPAPEAPTEAGT